MNVRAQIISQLVLFKRIAIDGEAALCYNYQILIFFYLVVGFFSNAVCLLAKEVI